MKKDTWLAKLKSELNATGMRAEERSAVLRYYEEMYQDKLDDGMTEAEILKEFGFPEDVAQSVKDDTGWSKPKSTATYRTSPDYRPHADSEYGDYAYNPYTPPRYNAQNPIPPVQATNSGDKSTQMGKGFSIAAAICLSVFAFVFIVAGIGIAIGGVATMVSGFFTGSAAIIVLLLGIGICLFAGGGLLCAAGGAMLKYWKRAGRH